MKKVLLLILVVLTGITSLSYAQRWIMAGVVTNPGEDPSISVVDSYNVWIAGGSPDTPRVYRTTNGGQEWFQVNTSGISKQINCIYALSPQLVFVAEGVLNSNAKLLRTTNAGLNWTVVLQTGNNGGYFTSLVFSPTNPLVGAALADKLYLTTNGGLNWIEQANVANSGSAKNSLMLIDQLFYGFGLSNGASRVRVTTNGGINWVNQNLNLSGSLVCGFAYKDDKLTGVASTSTSLPNIARTTNGGSTWVPLNIGEGLVGKSYIKWISGTNIVYILGENGAIKRSTNGGLNWVGLENTGVNGLTHLSFVNINSIIYGYAVSKYGYVVKLVDSVQYFLTGISNNVNVDNFKLLQNYPNPFNPVTNICFEIPKLSFVKLIIFDVLGKEVETLANGFYSEGKHQIVWDASRYSGGVYFYRINTEYFSDTKKMILIK
ncbi:MAG: T9SS type A sorting domain-containing protein [Ignavibacteria bacterium]|nr:T9SS type A sorting domain-containing protein [Ignavibacteria bacterium]